MCLLFLSHCNQASVVIAIRNPMHQASVLIAITVLIPLFLYIILLGFCFSSYRIQIYVILMWSFRWKLANLRGAATGVKTVLSKELK